MVIQFIIMRISRFIRIIILLFLFTFSLTLQLYAQSDYIYKGLRFNDDDKELQFWNSYSKSWNDVDYNQHLIASNKVKCPNYFKLRHNNRISLYAPIKRAALVSELKPTCEPKRVRKTLVKGENLFYDVVNLTNSAQYKPHYSIDFYVVDQNDVKIETVKAGSTIFLVIVNNGDSLFCAHLVGQRTNMDTNYDVLSEEKNNEDYCLEILLPPYSISRYEMSLDNYVGLNELLLVSYIAPGSIIGDDGIIDEGGQVSVIDLMSDSKRPNGGPYNTIFNYSSFKTLRK